MLFCVLFSGNESGYTLIDLVGEETLTGNRVATTISMKGTSGKLAMDMFGAHRRNGGC